jgi:hypothetical protein
MVQIVRVGVDRWMDGWNAGRGTQGTGQIGEQHTAQHTWIYLALDFRFEFSAAKRHAPPPYLSI